MTTSELLRDVDLVFLLAVAALVGGGDGLAILATQVVMSTGLVAWWVATGRRH